MGNELCGMSILCCCETVQGACTAPTPAPVDEIIFEATDVAQLATAGNNGVPSEAFPLGNCQGDCDDDDDCSVRVLILSTWILRMISPVLITLFALAHRDLRER